MSDNGDLLAHHVTADAGKIMATDLDEPIMVARLLFHRGAGDVGDHREEFIALDAIRPLINELTLLEAVLRPNPQPDPEKFVAYAWIGEDELGSGVVGLKQGFTAAGLIPLVSIDFDKIDRLDFHEQLQAQANAYGKTIRLVELGFVRDMTEINPQ